MTTPLPVRGRDAAVDALRPAGTGPPATSRQAGAS